MESKQARDGLIRSIRRAEGEIVQFEGMGLDGAGYLTVICDDLFGVNLVDDERGVTSITLTFHKDNVMGYHLITSTLLQIELGTRNEPCPILAIIPDLRGMLADESDRVTRKQFPNSPIAESDPHYQWFGAQNNEELVAIFKDEAQLQGADLEVHHEAMDVVKVLLWS